MNTQELADDGTPRPVLKVIRGDATPEEIAAILAIVTARRGAATPGEQKPPVTVWAAGHAIRRSREAPGGAPPGRSSWRTSYWPG
jgi:hypothetical protein